MMKNRLLIATLVVLLLPSLAGAVGDDPIGIKVQDRAPDGTPRILKGNLGNLGDARSMRPEALPEAARSALASILTREFGASGTEELIATRVRSDDSGGVHVRFEQRLNGLPVAGAGLVLHADADGNVLGVNGEFARGGKLAVTPGLASETALARAGFRGRRISNPELSYVIGAKGAAHLAWKVTVEYNDERGPQRDVVFADAETGELVARHPQYKYGRSLETKDCNQRKRNCSVVSTSPNAINTGDLAIDSAHNYAIATYDYYFANHGRDSIDDAGMTLISRVHYDRNYNNAFWDGTQMTYGDGDGVTFVPLSQDADVVAHELTHGVTERTSGLIYQNESGALNEALSDIFGAMVDRQEGATGADIWLIGEDIYTPGIPGDALRDMACPSCVGDYDYYPTRYTGTADNGGVHWNSGIANLAFKLLVTGGSHPAGATTVNVPAIGFDAAADIFYAANVGCLTPNSNFAAARYCTADVFGGSNAAAVHAAWDAVGVPNDPPPPPNPPIALTDGVATTGQDADTGNIQQYTLDVDAGSTVTCSTVCNNGDADLYLRFGAEAEANPNSTANECGSYSSTSNESCTTGAASSADTLYAAVHAYAAYTNLSITCTESPGGGGCTLGAPGDSCSSDSECCSNSCKGKPGSKTCR